MAQAERKPVPKHLPAFSTAKGVTGQVFPPYRVMVVAANRGTAKPYPPYKVVSAAGEGIERVFALHALVTAVDQNANA